MSILDTTAASIIPVTPSDDANLPDGTCLGLLIAVAGNIKITDYNGKTNTIAVPEGVLPVKIIKVWAGETTATGISALY
jgi:hypothetical protein